MSINVQNTVYWTYDTGLTDILKWRSEGMNIVVGGQIAKQEVAELIEKHKGNLDVTISVKGDLAAANDIKNGNADYYFGACHTGGGGALAMAIAILGRGKTASVSNPGKVMPEEKIREEVRNGKIAFGFTGQDREKVIPIILDEISKL